MNRMLKKWRSVTALLLAMSMVLGMSGIVYASNTKSSEEPKKKYVSLGDSMANGYGLDGYWKKDGSNVNGFLVEVTGAYPSKVANHYGWAFDESSQLATSAMRAEDLRFILEYDNEDIENSYPGDAYTEDEFINNRFNDYTDRAETEATYDQSKSGVANVAGIYQKEVREADVISMGIGNANIGVYALGRVMDVLEGKVDANENEFKDALAELDPEVQKIVMQIYDEVIALLEKEVTPSPKVRQLADAVGYTVVSYILNYNAVLNDIVKMNPDAEIILVGLMNTMSGVNVKFTYEGQEYTVPFGRVIDYAVSTINLYLAALPAAYQLAENEAFADATIYFAEARNVDMMVTDIATSAKTPIYRTRLIESVVDEVFSLMGITTGITLKDVELVEKSDFEALNNEYGDKTTNVVTACGTYIAFENAVIEACKDNTLDASAFLALENGMAGLEGIFKNLVIGEDTEPEEVTAQLLADPAIKGLLNLFGRMLVGNGIGCHPSAKGHDTLTAAIVDAYDNGNTVDVETVEKLEAAFAKIQKWIELYGEDALRYGYEWAEENGYIDQLKDAAAELKAEIKAYAEEVIPAIKAELKALKAELEDLKAQLKNASAELKAEIEAKIAEIEAKIAELEAKLAEIEAKVKEVIAAVEGLEDAINNFVELIKKGAIESVNAAIEEIQKALDKIANAISNVEDLVNAINKAIDEVQAFAEEVVEGLKALKAEVEAKVDEAIKDVEAALEQAEALANQIAAEAEKAFAEIEAKVKEVIAAAEAVYADATTAEYKVSADSYYVALGDAAASDYYADPASYASLVAEELGIDSVNLAESGLSVPALLEALEDEEVASEIAAADLITVGFNATGILEAAFTVEKTDWAAYVGEEGAAYIEAAVAEAAAAFTEAGLPAELVSIVEAFPYALVEYMANFHKVAGEIHEINEDALVILVGMYNPLEGLSANIDGEEVALGDFVDGLIEVSNLHMTACAMLEENTIFVEAPAVETWFEQDGGDVTAAVEYIMALLDGDGYLYPSDLGHEYIKEQILGALTITEPDYIKGDVNDDGKVNIQDLAFLRRYLAKFEGIEINLNAADVNEDTIVNIQDLAILRRYLAKMISEL